MKPERSNKIVIGDKEIPFNGASKVLFEMTGDVCKIEMCFDYKDDEREDGAIKVTETMMVSGFNDDSKCSGK